MNYCKHCGKTIAEGAAVCDGCGAAIDLTDGGQSYLTDGEVQMWKRGTRQSVLMPTTDELTVPKRSRKKHVIRIAAIAGGVFVLLITAAVLLFVLGKKPEEEKVPEEPETTVVNAVDGGLGEMRRELSDKVTYVKRKMTQIKNN